MRDTLRMGRARVSYGEKNTRKRAREVERQLSDPLARPTIQDTRRLDRVQKASRSSERVRRAQPGTFVGSICVIHHCTQNAR